MRNEHPVCFVSLSQSFGHYNVVATKWGSPLTLYKEKGILSFIDILSMTRECLGDDTKNHSFLLGVSANPKGSMKELIDLIKQKYDKLKECTSKTPVIIIDNLSLWIDIGYSINQVIHFVNVLNRLVLKPSQPDLEAGSFISNLDSGLTHDDIDKTVLWKYMSHMSDMTIEVSGLDSGFCKEVHGKIKVSWKDSLLKITSRIMQFRVMDKSIALFASGMSSAVI
ncbi:hypothetical protein FSP39_023737 [Pinctada imbricata]|uniref:Elongator complex protein 6 n=1 Tax=Pinctada imbricata TaxID=66713 RepID=A0AA88Y9D6_PINIB|nr:hypothetical protein FSP39_023737 [Pinctada imbricata]